MPFREPLPLDVLKYLARQRKGDADVQALLWEIRRLHSFVARQHQFTESQLPWGPLLTKLWADLATDVCNEPCVQKLVQIQQRSINP